MSDKKSKMAAKYKVLKGSQTAASKRKPKYVPSKPFEGGVPF
jgi:hypothetical protein